MATTEKRPARPTTYYETLLIAEPTVEKEQVDQFVKRVETTIQRHGGKLLRNTDWGKRRLSYEIKKHQEGYYLLLEFTGSSDTARKFEDYLNLQSTILRYLTLQKKAEANSLPVTEAN